MISYDLGPTIPCLNITRSAVKRLKTNERPGIGFYKKEAPTLKHLQA